jgi:hypothetical protein
MTLVTSVVALAMGLLVASCAGYPAYGQYGYGPYGYGYGYGGRHYDHDRHVDEHGRRYYGGNRYGYGYGYGYGYPNAYPYGPWAYAPGYRYDGRGHHDHHRDWDDRFDED